MAKADTRHTSFMREKAALTKRQLHQLFEYDPDTGDLRWRVSRKGGCRKGEIAGKRNSGGYRQVEINGRLYLVHRLIWIYMRGSPANGEVDHENRNPTDNRVANLRVATSREGKQTPAAEKRTADSSGLIITSSGSAGTRE